MRSFFFFGLCLIARATIIHPRSSPLSSTKLGESHQILVKRLSQQNSRLKRQRWPQRMLAEVVWRDDKKEHRSLFTFCCRSGCTISIITAGSRDLGWIWISNIPSFQFRVTRPPGLDTQLSDKSISNAKRENSFVAFPLSAASGDQFFCCCSSASLPYRRCSALLPLALLCWCLG